MPMRISTPVRTKNKSTFFPETSAFSVNSRRTTKTAIAHFPPFDARKRGSSRSSSGVNPERGLRAVLRSFEEREGEVRFFFFFDLVIRSLLYGSHDTMKYEFKHDKAAPSWTE